TAMFVLPAEGKPVMMERMLDEGVFVAKMPAGIESYRLEAEFGDGAIINYDDPYRFWPTLGELDLHLFGEGRHHDLWKQLGAHYRTHERVTGTAFAVWAPNAQSVRVVGDFNLWDGRVHPMRSLGASGVWELFIPGVGEGELYKFEVRDQRGNVRLKTDPYGTYFEGPPNNAAIVFDPRKIKWSDDAWLERRRNNA